MARDHDTLQGTRDKQSQASYFMFYCVVLAVMLDGQRDDMCPDMCLHDLHALPLVNGSLTPGVSRKVQPESLPALHGKLHCKPSLHLTSWVLPGA